MIQLSIKQASILSRSCSHMLNPSRTIQLCHKKCAKNVFLNVNNHRNVSPMIRKNGQIVNHRNTTTSGPLHKQSPPVQTTSIKRALHDIRSPISVERINNILLTPRYLPIPRWISPYRPSFNFSECFGHLSFVLVAVSYATDDFLLLRTIAVVGSSFMMVFTYFHPHGRILWLPFQWNGLFILINSYRIGTKMYLQSMGDRLSNDLKRIKNEHFDSMEMSDFVNLVSIATEETFESGELVCYQGFRNRYIRMVIDGELEVRRDGVQTYTMREGNFVSEAGLHAGLLLSGEVESSCTVIAKPSLPGQPTKSVRVLRWDRSELTNMLKKQSGLRRCLTGLMSLDIVRKVKGQRRYISEHMVDDVELWTQKRREQSEDRYASIIQNVLQYPNLFEQRRDELNKYRIIHHIDDEHHKLALERCGWTIEDYEAGECKRNVTHLAKA